MKQQGNEKDNGSNHDLKSITFSFSKTLICFFNTWRLFEFGGSVHTFTSFFSERNFLNISIDFFYI